MNKIGCFKTSRWPPQHKQTHGRRATTQSRFDSLKLIFLQKADNVLIHSAVFMTLRGEELWTWTLQGRLKEHGTPRGLFINSYIKYIHLNIITSGRRECRSISSLPPRWIRKLQQYLLNMKNWASLQLQVIVCSNVKQNRFDYKGSNYNIMHLHFMCIKINK